jgi:hypothetical protein
MQRNFGQPSQIAAPDCGCRARLGSDDALDKQTNRRNTTTWQARYTSYYHNQYTDDDYYHDHGSAIIPNVFNLNISKSPTGVVDALDSQLHQDYTIDSDQTAVLSESQLVAFGLKSCLFCILQVR